MTRKIKTEENYQPVAFDPKTYAKKRRKADPVFRAAYGTLEEEFTAFDRWLQAMPDVTPDAGDELGV